MITLQKINIGENYCFLGLSKDALAMTENAYYKERK